MTSDAQRKIEILREALETMTRHYVAMINSGDCGSWNPETDDPVIKARAALSLTEPKEK